MLSLNLHKCLENHGSFFRDQGTPVLNMPSSPGANSQELSVMGYNANIPKVTYCDLMWSSDYIHLSIINNFVTVYYEIIASEFQIHEVKSNLFFPSCILL